MTGKAFRKGAKVRLEGAEAAALDVVAKAQDRVVNLTKARAAAVADRAKAISAARSTGVTLSRLAQVLDVTVERVRQMEQQTGPE